MILQNNRLFHKLLFLATGICQTLCIQWLYYQGAANGFSLFTVSCIYISLMMLSIFNLFSKWLYFGKERKDLFTKILLAPPKYENVVGPLELDGFFDKNDEFATLLSNQYKSNVKIKSWHIPFTAFIEFIACFCCNFGLFLIGSGIYQIIYSSIILFTALFSKLLLRKKLSKTQWLGLIVITFGLCVSAIKTTKDKSDPNNEKVLFFSFQDKDAKSHIFGVWVTLIGTILYSLSYIYNEYLLHSTSMQPETLGPKIGIFGFIYSLVYMCIYTIPRIDELFLTPVQLNGGNLTHIIWAYLFLIANGCLHSMSYFVLVRSIGATSTGVIQSLRAVIVFGLSAILFSAIDDNQSFNYFKGLASFIVFVGIIIFSSNKNL